MAIGYELTGDARYLACGKKTFEKGLENIRGALGGKKLVEDAVIEGSGSTKNFAQSFLPITNYYVQMTKSVL